MFVRHYMAICLTLQIAHFEKGITTGVIPKSLPVVSTEPILRKVDVDQEIRFSIEQYGCRQRHPYFDWMPARSVISIFLCSDYFFNV